MIRIPRAGEPERHCARVIVAAVRAGMKQSDIARALGVSRQRVHELWRKNTGLSYQAPDLAKKRVSASGRNTRTSPRIPRAARYKQGLADTPQGWNGDPDRPQDKIARRILKKLGPDHLNPPFVEPQRAKTERRPQRGAAKGRTSQQAA